MSDNNQSSTNNNNSNSHDTSSETQSGSHEKTKWTSVKDVGVATDTNSRYRRTMEDAHVVVDNFGGEATQGYFAIYDGHGGRGAVDFTAENLHVNLLKEIAKNPDDMKEALKQSYLSTDRDISEKRIQAGTTAVSALIQRSKDGSKRWLYVANAGDARAVIGRKGKAVRLSYDHKGSDESETKRITDLGGFMLLNRVNGILAVTRSLGDSSMKEYVIGEPFMTATELNEDDTHLILACDGLWDVASDQEALDLILNDTDATLMSQKLLQYALKKGSTDNVSIMVILL